MMNGGYGMLYGQQNPYASPNQQQQNHNAVFGSYSYAAPAQSGYNRPNQPNQSQQGQNQDVFAGLM